MREAVKEIKKTDEKLAAIVQKNIEKYERIYQALTSDWERKLPGNFKTNPWIYQIGLKAAEKWKDKPFTSREAMNFGHSIYNEMEGKALDKDVLYKLGTAYYAWYLSLFNMGLLERKPIVGSRNGQYKFENEDVETIRKMCEKPEDSFVKGTATFRAMQRVLAEMRDIDKEKERTRYQRLEMKVKLLEKRLEKKKKEIHSQLSLISET